VVAVLGAIVLGGLGGGTGEAVEMLARAASGNMLAHAFRFVFLTCGLVLAFGLASWWRWKNGRSKARRARPPPRRRRRRPRQFRQRPEIAPLRSGRGA
jgi:hypothetical protein